MLREELKSIASALVSDGKGILASDETVEYMGKVLNSIGLENSEETRRLYKQLLFTSDKAENYISGIILLPETVYQKSDDGTPFLKLLKGKGILPGVNVDGGLVHLNGTVGETTTAGFDSLNELCKRYKKEGCCFAKWRCALKIGRDTPSLMAIKENANVLARYAATCQVNGLVPIVEPEVQLEGDHDLKKAQHVSELVLFHVYKALFEYGVYLEGTLLKPAMVMPGRSFSGKCTSDEIGKATVEVLSRTVPAAVPGIGFLSGGQTADEATENLLAINRHKGKMPWALTFIFGRALQESVATIWKGEKKNVVRAQAELLRRAQVSRLVILHEEAEDGNAMPDLEQPVKVVSNAVLNLVKVGKETINSSDDPILRQDMPPALVRVEKSSKLLEEASGMLKQDPFSGPARKRLIEGSGGILQATSALLLCFDESEVRKIIRECKRVLDYLAVAEVIESMEELVQFLRDLSPCLSKVSREVSAREKELTHQVHAEILIRCLEQVKVLAPILICSMKIYIHIITQGGKGGEEAAENRNYLTGRMSDEINEIIRVLQLTSYDEDQSELDNLTVLKKLQNAIQNKINNVNDWLLNPAALRGGIGEKSLRQIIEAAYKVADRCLPQDSYTIKKLCSDITTMTDALCELRQDGKGATPQAESLARGIKDKLGHLQQAVLNAVIAVDKAGLQQTAHTVKGRLEQARKWLSNPGHDDKGLGQRAIALVVEEGRKVADGLPGVQKAEILQLCDDVDGLSRQLAALCASGKGDSPQGHEIARKLAHKLHELKERINQAVTNRVVEDFIDIVTPLKQFTEAVLVLEGTPNRDQNFSDKAANLQQFSNRAVKTAKMVAAGGSGGNKKLAEALQSSASQVESLTPVLISAGSIRLNYPTSKAADEHFENLRQQYADTLTKVRNLCDEATDSADFIKASEEQMRKHTFLCEEAIKNGQPQKMVDNTSAIARLANRVLLVAKQESDNSEDPNFIDEVNQASDQLQNCVPLMVQDAKHVAINPSDHNAVSHWRESNKGLLNAVGQVRKAIQPDVPPLPDINSLNLVGESLRNTPTPTPGTDFDRISSPTHQYGRVSPLPKWARGDNSDLLCQRLISNNSREPGIRNVLVSENVTEDDTAPPRPPLPSSNDGVPMRPPPPETDDEDDIFKHAPNASQPIMVAAHNLHREVRQWSAKDNELIAAARKMALLMARLSELVHNDDKGSKRELIATAKAIAEASEAVTRIAKQLARECTDKRIRTNLLQVCERIPTIATQLKILSTVKATMLGAQGSEEDREATEMLEGNAQNLMQSVKETVRAAEGASIKIHSQSHGRLLWVRRMPWYHYN